MWADSRGCWIVWLKRGVAWSFLGFLSCSLDRLARESLSWVRNAKIRIIGRLWKRSTDLNRIAFFFREIRNFWWERESIRAHLVHEEMCTLRIKGNAIRATISSHLRRITYVLTKSLRTISRQAILHPHRTSKVDEFQFNSLISSALTFLLSTDITRALESPPLHLYGRYIRG